MQVFGDLISELDSLTSRERLLALVKGVLAGNIFDWGAQACVGLYHNGRILDIYRKARTDICHRPWRVDHFDKLEKAWFAGSEGAQLNRLGVLCGAWWPVCLCLTVLSTWGTFPCIMLLVLF